MKENKSNTAFWAVLAVVNALGLIYPVNLLLRAENTNETLFAALRFIGFVFLLVVVDGISIVVADAVGTTRG